MGAIKKINN